MCTVEMQRGKTRSLEYSRDKMPYKEIKETTGSENLHANPVKENQRVSIF